MRSPGTRVEDGNTSAPADPAQPDTGEWVKGTVALSIRPRNRSYRKYYVERRSLEKRSRTMLALLYSGACNLSKVFHDYASFSP